MDIVEKRSGSLTDALNKIRIAETRIIELKTELSNWKLDADIDVALKDDDICVHVRIFKDNGDGFAFDISGGDIRQAGDDIDTLTQIIAERIYDMLYKKQIKNVIVAKLNTAIQNVRLRQKGTVL